MSRPKPEPIQPHLASAEEMKKNPAASRGLCNRQGKAVVLPYRRSWWHFCFFSAYAPRTSRETLAKPCKPKSISKDIQICHQYLTTRPPGSGCSRSKPAAPSAGRAEMSWPPLLIRLLPNRQNLPPPPNQQSMRHITRSIPSRAYSSSCSGPSPSVSCSCWSK